MISKKYSRKYSSRKNKKSKTRHINRNRNRNRNRKGGQNKTRKEVREDKKERKERFEKAMNIMDDKSLLEPRGSLFRKSIMPHMKERAIKDYKEMKQRQKEKNESSSLVNLIQAKKYVPVSNIYSFAEEEEEEEE